MEILNLKPGYQLIGFPKGYDGKYASLEKLTHHVLNYLVGPYNVKGPNGLYIRYFKVNKEAYIRLNENGELKILDKETLRAEVLNLENKVVTKFRSEIRHKLDTVIENNKMINLLLK